VAIPINTIFSGMNIHLPAILMFKTNSTPVVHIKIAGKWMFIPLKMVLIGIATLPFLASST
jgi:hypothetical protein